MGLIKHTLIGLAYGIFCAGTKNIFPAYICEFLSSIAVWTFVVVFSCRKSKTISAAIISSTATMLGIFVGYYIVLALRVKQFSFSYYEIFWMFVAVAFSLALGFIIYIDGKNFKILNIFVPCTFFAEALWEMKDRHFLIFWRELIDCPLLILCGIISFIRYNHNNLRDLKIYLKSVVFLFCEIGGIYTIYNLLYLIVRLMYML